MKFRMQLSSSCIGWSCWLQVPQNPHSWYTSTT